MRISGNYIRPVDPGTPRRLAALFGLCLLAACSGGRHSSKSSTTTVAAAVAPPSGNLYEAPLGMRPAAPGTRIWTQFYAQTAKSELFGVPTTVWSMLYHSRDRTGRDIAVSGYVVVPKRPAPAQGRPVYAWAHDNVGLGDRCTPSKRIADNLPLYGAPLLRRGAVLVATDYEGLGPAGDHPYLVGDSEAHAVLDSVRAAASLPDVGRVGDVVIAGIGEGGAAALFAAERAKQYAPELHVRGVVALAPTADLPAVFSSPRTAGSILIEAMAGLRTAYPDFDPSSVMTPAASADISRVRTQCVATIAKRYPNAHSVLTRDPNTVPAVKQLLLENSPGASSPGAPVLLVQGGGQDAASITTSLRDAYCASGATVERLVAADEGRGFITAARQRVVAWIDGRYGGKRPPSDCE
jgi:hypothetical protein